MNTLLTVGLSEEDRSAVRRVLSPRGWVIGEVHGCGQVFEQLRERRYQAVLSECFLNDGDWEDVLAELTLFSPAPPLFVVYRHADHRLWAEILSLGGYDLLMAPFDGNELVRVMSLIADRHERLERPHDLAPLAAVASS